MLTHGKSGGCSVRCGLVAGSMRPAFVGGTFQNLLLRLYRSLDGPEWSNLDRSAVLFWGFPRWPSYEMEKVNLYQSVIRQLKCGECNTAYVPLFLDRQRTIHGYACYRGRATLRWTPLYPLLLKTLTAWTKSICGGINFADSSERGAADAPLLQFRSSQGDCFFIDFFFHPVSGRPSAHILSGSISGSTHVVLTNGTFVSFQTR
jgi:hypothetical protein